MIIQFQDEQYIPLEMVLRKINVADDCELSDMIRAIVERYSLVFPDWDVMFLSLPKDPKERRRQLELTFDFLNKHIP